jgi:hypothetical protein
LYSHRISPFVEGSGRRFRGNPKRGKKSHRRQMKNKRRNVRDEDGSFTGTQAQVNHYDIGGEGRTLKKMPSSMVGNPACRAQVINSFTNRELILAQEMTLSRAKLRQDTAVRVGERLFFRVNTGRKTAEDLVGSGCTEGLGYCRSMKSIYGLFIVDSEHDAISEMWMD